MHKDNHGNTRVHYKSQGKTIFNGNIEKLKEKKKIILNLILQSK